MMEQLVALFPIRARLVGFFRMRRMYVEIN